MILYFYILILVETVWWVFEWKGGIEEIGTVDSVNVVESDVEVEIKETFI